MTEIYLIRHAESEGNLYRRIHGWTDSAVTDMGLKQIEALGKRFKQVKIDAVYSSDKKRTRLTASAISAPKGLVIKQLPDLREVYMGVWEDRCWGEVEMLEPEQSHYLSFSPDKWHIEGAESYEKSLGRITAAIYKIADENKDKTVAVVSHGCIIRILLSNVLGNTPSEINNILYCDNTAVSLLRVDGKNIEVAYHNDNSHLPKEISAFHRETWWTSDNAKDGRDMYFLPMDVWKSGDLYLRRYRDAWIQSHGHDAGFTSIYLEWARKRSQVNPYAVMEAYLEGTPCGMLELAEAVNASEGVGHIAFLYLEEAYRNKGLAIQLIGQAQSFYSKLGRKKLRLHVTEANQRAFRFYEKYGFKLAGREPGQFGDICIMEKQIL